jgi:phosphoglycolate phosphatase-like HAD superfamily hydrolase/ADP-ribose pyrophosphatase YjhB (NUDIX family)
LQFARTGYALGVIRNIIFDWSGTLVDDLPAVLAATNHTFAKWGVPPLTMDRFRAEFSLPFKDFYLRFLPGIPVTELEPVFHGHFTTANVPVEEIPHAREFLKFCRDHGLRTFVLSTVHPAYYAKQTAANGFDKYIDRAYLAVWDKRRKIAQLLSENNLAAEETLFIGDMQHDIETARHGGVFSCGVLTGYNRLEQLRESKPDLIVEHLGELREILLRKKFNFRAVAGEPNSEAAHQPVGTVGALIYNDAGEVLMVRTQKWSGLWGIPGGKIKYGESSTDALRREILEETNLQISDIRFVLEQDCIRSKEFYREAHFLLLNYTCRAQPGGEVRLNEEAQEFRWVTTEQALQMDLNQPTRFLVNQVCKEALPKL